MNSYFDKYKKIKKKLSYYYKGYNLGEIIAFDIISHIYFNKKNELEYKSYRQILSQIKQSPYIRNIKKICEHPGVFITMTNGQYSRNDYHELVELTSKKVDKSIVVVLNIDNNVKSIPLFSQAFILFLLTFLNNYRKLFNLLNIKEILLFSCRLHYYKKIIDNLEDIDDSKVKIEKYISFNGSLNYENILVKFFKKRGIPTYSLQHAIMDRYFIKQIFPSYDSINIENLQTDYLLCWSQNTIDQITNSSMTSTELLLVGNPKYSQWQIREIKQSFTKCLVFLGGKGDDLINLEVIEIIKKLSEIRRDIEFFFKLHPQNLNKKYSQEITEYHNIKVVPTNEVLSTLLINSEFDFTVSYNTTTTVYYESLCYGLPCFSYNPDKTINVYALKNNHFSTVEELEERILYFQQVEPSVLLGQIQEVLKQKVGINIDNYHQYFS